MIEFELNGKPTQVQAEADTPLLWVLRDHLQLCGTKFGCGIGACGACTVHVEGAAVRSCVLPVEAAQGQKVRTIEGLAMGDQLHALQKLWLEHQVPQCGYCQSGMLMAASAMFEGDAVPSAAEVDQVLNNICRCGTYVRIRQAVHALISQRQAANGASA
jgi:aerobic-type carbon monoxide dehydrogenase small subunit (CoxS/CutS family)